MSVQEEYARFCIELAASVPPPEVVEQAKKVVLDVMANMIGGYRWMESGPVILAGVRDLAEGATGSATVLATGERMPASWAALANGSLGHSLEYDNHHAEGVIHPSSSVVAAALAAAEARGATGAELLSAVVAGLEISCRLAMACNPMSAHEAGFHPTGTCAVFGATAAVGMLYGLSADQLAHAFGINGSQAAGSTQYMLNRAWNKRAHPGLAAHSAFLAVGLAAQGFVGTAQAVEGDEGFLQAYSLRPRPELAAAEIGRRWETLELAIKPFPLCRYTHMILDLLVAYRRSGVDPASIRSIAIELPTYGARRVGSPIDAKRRPATAAQAQFSAPFAAALAMSRGEAGIGVFRDVVDHGLDDPELHRLMDLTTVSAADDLNAIHPRLWPSRITVTLEDDEVVLYGEHVRGERGNPMSWTDLRAKFEELVPDRPAAFLDEVTRGVQSLDSFGVADLLAPFARRT
jgi:2-methylcitrate dehydratase PrpD